MAAITVANLFANVIGDTNLGYVWVIKVGENSQGTETLANAITAVEMFTLLNKEAKAWYQIGEYWYVVV